MRKHVLPRPWKCAHYLHVGIVLLLLGALPAWSQATSTGTVSGQVADQQNAVIGGAGVQLTDNSTSATQRTTTNDAGRFIFVNVSPGTYTLTVTKPGFNTFKAVQQKVDVGSALTINAVLEVGAVTSIVEVTTAPGAELQLTNATVGTTLTGQSLVYLPNLSREASSLAIFQPGVSPEGSVAGAIYDQNT